MLGAILSAKAQSDAQLAEVRGEARKTITILHKLQTQYTKEMVMYFSLTCNMALLVVLM